MTNAKRVRDASILVMFVECIVCLTLRLPFPAMDLADKPYS